MSKSVSMAILLLMTCVSYAQMSAKEIFAKYQDSIVSLEVATKDGIATGTGFLFGGGKYIATCFHVLEGGKSVKILAGGDLQLKASSYQVDRKRDIAIIRLEKEEERKGIPFSAKDMVEPGTEVSVIGNPLGLEKSISNGLISGYRRDGESLVVQVTAPISQGSSGSPIIDPKGECVGMITSSFVNGQNLNLGISTKDIRKVFEDSEEYNEADVWFVVRPARPEKEKQETSEVVVDVDKLGHLLFREVLGFWQQIGKEKTEFYAMLKERNAPGQVLWTLNDGVIKRAQNIREYCLVLRKYFNGCDEAIECLNRFTQAQIESVSAQGRFLISNNFRVDSKAETDRIITEFVTTDFNAEDRLAKFFDALVLIELKGDKKGFGLETKFFNYALYLKWLKICLDSDGVFENSIRGVTFGAAKEFKTGDTLKAGRFEGEERVYNLTQEDERFDFIMNFIRLKNLDKEFRFEITVSEVGGRKKLVKFSENK